MRGDCLPDGPFSSSPMTGEVPHRVSGTSEPQPRVFTFPFTREAGRGPSASVSTP
jgi:hypothetical protein